MEANAKLNIKIIKRSV